MIGTSQSVVVFIFAIMSALEKIICIPALLYAIYFAAGKARKLKAV